MAERLLLIESRSNVANCVRQLFFIADAYKMDESGRNHLPEADLHCKRRSLQGR